MTNYTVANVDPFLVVGFTILMVVMLIINIYILTYWQHPDDKAESVFPKILIVFGLQLSAVSVLMLPVGKLVPFHDGPSKSLTSLFLNQ